MVEGRLAETVELCAPLLGADAEDGVRLRAVLASVGALSLSGELTRAIAEADRGSDLAVRCAAEMPWAAPQLAAARSVALLAAGEMGEMMSESRRGYERALSYHDEEARAIFGFALGRGFLHQGRVISAARHLQESTALNREHGFIFLRSGLLYLAFALAMTGDQQGAEAALHEAQRHRGGVPVLYESEHLRARACVLASAGETSAAQRAALDAATAATGGQAWTLALWALHDAARWGAAKTTASRLARVAEHVDGPLVPLMLEHTRAMASDDAVALARVSAGFEMVGFQLYAAEAAAQAARTCARQGRNPLALAAGRRHQALADLCEGAITPALRASVSHGLTPREEEIATLAARGLSDNDIADKLVLSVRTVHSHLRNIYMKLEVSGRRGLQDYLTP
jgi:ATP/maltotriose-dependent transcriptional regulator MalT